MDGVCGCVCKFGGGGGGGGGVLCVDFVDHSQSVNNNLMTVPRMCSTFT